MSFMTRPATSRGSQAMNRHGICGESASTPGCGWRRALVAALTAAALTGCAVGPDFRQPAAPTTNAYTAAPLSSETASAPVTGGEAQRFVAGRDIPGQWWTLFHSPALDRLIRQALADSPTLAAAQATLRQAQENLRARVGRHSTRAWTGTPRSAPEDHRGILRPAGIGQQRLSPSTTPRSTSPTSSTCSAGRAANWRRCRPRSTTSASSWRGPI